MKTAVCIFLIASQIQGSAQFLKSVTGSVSFFSEAPLENIDATSQNMVSVIKTETGEITFMVTINSFQFKKQKMQVDFNEDFMESSRFPMATYTGKINEPLDWTKNGTYKVTANGKLTIHGIAKARADTATISIKEGKITMNSNFKIRVDDYGIRIPKVLFEKIAEVVAVKLKMSYKILPEEKKSIESSK